VCAPAKAAAHHGKKFGPSTRSSCQQSGVAVVMWMLCSYCLRWRGKPRPANPTPSSASVAGSGTLSSIASRQNLLGLRASADIGSGGKGEPPYSDRRHDLLWLWIDAIENSRRHVDSLSHFGYAYLNLQIIIRADRRARVADDRRRLRRSQRVGSRVLFMTCSPGVPGRRDSS
jgi:hypothetical protein